MKEENLNEVYKSLEIGIGIINKPEYKNLVNFSLNLNYPIHNWFDIKEGYSRNLIIDLISRFGIKKNDFIMDPFCGSGTTLLAAKEKGINSIGFEINPFLMFLTRIKLTDFSYTEINDLQNELNKIKSLNFKSSYSTQNPPKLSISKKLFDKRLSKLLMLKGYILSIPDSKKRDFFFLTFLSILENISIAKKDGNGLKYPKNKIPEEVMQAFFKKAEKMIHDLKKRDIQKSKNYLFQEDVRNLCNRISENDISKFKNKISFIVFSPPYMNCFDYAEVYKIELWFGDFVKDYSDLKALREQSLISHINTKLKKRRLLKNRYVELFVQAVNKQKLWNKKIPFMIEGYFDDMRITLNGLYQLLKEGNYCIIVVGNSAYGNIAIPTDTILGRIGLDIGFKNCSIEVARHLGTSSQQYNKVNNQHILRESLVILKK